jgi:hypothetical protein
VSSGIPGTYKNVEVDRFAGTIGVLTAERGTYAAFWNDLHSTHINMGWHDERPTFLNIQMGVDICGNLNKIIRNLRGGWLWIMGDDHLFQPDLLPTLLAHDADVVVPHCLRRNPPWQPVVNSHEDDDGWQVSAELPQEGLTEIWSAGSAGMLIRRHVLEAIGDPWFTPAADAVGLNEDINFCRKVRAAGFQIWCDPAAPLGHISTYTVYPRWDEELARWEVDSVYDQQTVYGMRRPGVKVLA